MPRLRSQDLRKSLLHKVDGIFRGDSAILVDAIVEVTPQLPFWQDRAGTGAPDSPTLNP